MRQREVNLENGEKREYQHKVKILRQIAEWRRDMSGGLLKNQRQIVHQRRGGGTGNFLHKFMISEDE